MINQHIYHQMRSDIILQYMIKKVKEFLQQAKHPSQLHLNSKYIFKILSFVLDRKNSNQNDQSLQQVLQLIPTMNKYDHSLIKQMYQAIKNKMSESRLSKSSDTDEEFQCPGLHLRQYGTKFHQYIDDNWINSCSKQGKSENIDQINEKLNSLALGQRLQEESEQPCLNCLTSFHNDVMPVTCQTSFQLEYHQSTINRKFGEHTCAILNNGGGCLLLTGSNFQQRLSDQQFTEPISRNKLIGIHIQQLESISESNVEEQIQEYFSQQFQQQFHHYFSHNFSQNTNKYICVKLLPLKDQQYYIIKICLRVQQIHKLYSVRYRNKQLQDAFIYFVAGQDQIRPLTQDIYNYAQITSQKPFQKKCQICSNYGACQDSGQYCRNCCCFGRVYHRKKELNGQFERMLTKNIIFRETMPPQFQYNHQSVLVSNIHHEQQMIKLANFNLKQLRINFMIFRPYYYYNQDAHHPIYIISHQPKHDTFKNSLNLDELFKGKYSVLNPHQFVCYNTLELQEQNKMIINELKKIIKVNFDADFEHKKGTLDQSKQLINMIKFEKIQHSIMGYIFMYKKVKQLKFTSSIKYNELRTNSNL